MNQSGRMHPLAGGVAIVLTFLTGDPLRAAPQQARRQKTPPPRAAVAQPPAPAVPPRYEFEKQPGPVNDALATLLDRDHPPAEGVEDAGARMTRIAAARQVVRANARTAAAAVIAELGKLPERDIEGHAELFSLLAVVADEDAAVQYWSRKVSSGTPRPPRTRREPRKKEKTPDQPRLQRSEREDPEAQIRYLAIAHLYRAARAGNEKARAAILEAAGSPHRDMRISAVQYTYALTPQRWKARRELEKRLPRSDQYLLYRY